MENKQTHNEIDTTTKSIIIVNLSILKDACNEKLSNDKTLHIFISIIA